MTVYTKTHKMQHFAKQNLMRLPRSNRAAVLYLFILVIIKRFLRNMP